MGEPDHTQSSRMRLLTAAKMLFARNGYEQTSTAAIAREAATSESQLVRYFTGKAGLLEAIFNESWQPLNERITTIVSSSANPREAISLVLSTMIEAFSRDHDLAFLFLFEGRRIRQTHDVQLSKGYLQFTDTFCEIVRNGQKNGSLRKDLSEQAISAALIGAAEGMIRERFVAERSGKPDPFSDDDIGKVFTALVQAF